MYVQFISNVELHLMIISLFIILLRVFSQFNCLVYNMYAYL